MNKALAGAIIAAGFLLGGCNGGGTPTTPSTPASSTPQSASPVSNGPSASQSSLEDGAAQGLVQFWAELDKLATDPSKPLSDLTSVARGQALTQWQRNLTQMRGQGYKQVGSVVVAKPAVTKETATDTYQVKACIDVSKVNVVDQDGKSVVAPNRAPRTLYTYEVQRDGDKFFVTKDPLQGDPC